jgi:hypothetical protein
LVIPAHHRFLLGAFLSLGGSMRRKPENSGKPKNSKAQYKHLSENSYFSKKINLNLWPFFHSPFFNIIYK